MSVVLWRFHMGTTKAPDPPPPPQIEIGGGLRRKKPRKPLADYLREAAEAFAAVENGTYVTQAERAKAEKKARRARSLAKAASLVITKQAEKSKQNDDEMILMLLFLDLL